MRSVYALAAALWILTGTLDAAERTPADGGGSSTPFVQLAEYVDLQPPPAEPPAAEDRTDSATALPRPRTPRSRSPFTLAAGRNRLTEGSSGRTIGDVDLSSMLADAPAILGHFYHSGGHFGSFYNTDLPLAGACGRLSVADNNRALTQDRVYFNYNHFHNAFERTVLAEDPNQDFWTRKDPASIDRFTLGAEKTFLDGLWSVEVRMPFADCPEFASSRIADVGVTGGDVGNLSVILKRVLVIREAISIVAGMGVETPTGSDAEISLAFERGLMQESYRVNNDAVSLVPYAGLLLAPRGDVFGHVFLQLNTPTNGNPVDFEFTDPIDRSSGRLGTLTPPTLFHVDVSTGVWLFRDGCTGCGEGGGLAAIAEFHYVTALSEIDMMFPFNGAPFIWDTGEYRVDVADVTLGLHAQFGANRIARMGAAFPLLEADRRLMDSEIIVQLEQRF